MRIIRFNLRRVLYFALILPMIGVLACTGKHSSEDVVAEGNAEIQKTYGVRNVHETAAYIKSVTGINVYTDNNNAIASTFATKRNSLSAYSTWNEKHARALWDVMYQVFSRLVTLESALAARDRKFFGEVNFSSGGTTQFTASKKESICNTLMTRFMGKKPSAEELTACSEVFDDVISAAVTIASGVPGNANRNEVLRVLGATVAASAFGSVAR